MTLILYDDANAGNQVWSQTFSGITVANGYYSVIMDFSIAGSHWSSTSSQTFDHQYWLTANVNSQLLSPRVQFTTSPYSFNARIADSAIHSANSVNSHIADSAIHIPSAPIGTVTAYAGDIIRLKANEKALGWYVCDGRLIRTADFPDYAYMAQNIYGVNGAADSVYLPDFRGLFLRGISGARADGMQDPDASTRAALGGHGLAGNQVGSVQSDATALYGPLNVSMGVVHVHPANGSGTDPFAWDGGTDYMSLLVKDGPVTKGSSDTYDLLRGGTKSGSETRPKNAYVYWIIKVR